MLGVTFLAHPLFRDDLGHSVISSNIGHRSSDDVTQNQVKLFGKWSCYSTCFLKVSLPDFSAGVFLSGNPHCFIWKLLHFTRDVAKAFEFSLFCGFKSALIKLFFEVYFATLHSHLIQSSVNRSADQSEVAAGARKNFPLSKPQHQGYCVV